jgi:hypothetical protein
MRWLLLVGALYCLVLILIKLKLLILALLDQFILLYTGSLFEYPSNFFHWWSALLFLLMYMYILSQVRPYRLFIPHMYSNQFHRLSLLSSPHKINRSTVGHVMHMFTIKNVTLHAEFLPAISHNK